MSSDRKCAECGKGTSGEMFCNDECRRLYDETMKRFGIQPPTGEKQVKLFPKSRKR